MTDTFEGCASDADLAAAITKAVDEASKQQGPGFSWNLVALRGSRGIVPHEVGVMIKVAKH
mgnify:CR=1 FL=1